MRGIPLSFSYSLASSEVGAHLYPTIWRPKLAYDTGTHGFGQHFEGGFCLAN